MKKLFVVVSLITCLLMSACSNTEEKSNSETKELPTFNVTLNVECVENLLFSRYDVDILIDSKEIGTLEHGKKDTYSIELEEGEHIISFEKEDDSSVDGKIKVNISNDTTIGYKISCTSDQIKTEEISGDAIEEEIEQGKENKEESNSSKIHPPYNTDSAKGLNYQDVVKAFRDAGFTNIITEKRFEAEFWGNEADTVANIYINSSGVHTDWTYESDSQVRIDYYVISDGSKSNTELSQYYAKKAFEEYGEANYPYGFKCHWVVNLINAEQATNGTWFFKVGVTIKNQYGTEYDTIAEGVVGGTDASPKVTQFHVSK